MGVPSFYRWLSEKYNKCVKFMVEIVAEEVDGVTIPVNTLDANPNGFEIDNLYFDLNGLIHPCCHPENKPQPESEDEMVHNVFQYLDRIVALCRPRRMIYMAIDGVAPRAKMNQQRSRRFRAAQEANEVKLAEDELRARFEEKGLHLPPKKEARWDHNVITPGTPFLCKMSEALKFYTSHRLSSDPGWQNVQVIFSDANVPGEGEHKIMEFVRTQRVQPGYTPNQTHAIFGLDADLIMLALATHEPHFYVVRETVLFGRARGCYKCGRKGHESRHCPGTPTEPEEEKDDTPPFQYVSCGVLREYLANELFVQTIAFEWNLERIIDDFIFLCFFVGNDFLPHLPSLEIREGALDDLMKLYIQLLPSLGGFITDSGIVNLKRAEVILTKIALPEAQVLKTRHEREQIRKQREMQEQQKQQSSCLESSGTKKQIKRSSPNVFIGEKRAVESQAIFSSDNENSNAAKRLRARLLAPKHEQDLVMKESGDKTITNSSDNNVEQKIESENKPDFVNELKAKIDRMNKPDQQLDKVRLHEMGYKKRYYFEKFGFEMPEDNDKIRQIVAAYTEGLCWVMLYYYRGCPSWAWFYPYHYAPFASDLISLDKIQPSLTLGKPFSPISQLMAVLPAASSHCVPPPFASLMSSSQSPILEFYPTEFQLDMNGKPMRWQAVALLPFIDAELLLKTLNDARSSLTPTEMARDSLGKNYLFVSAKSPVAIAIKTCYLKQEMSHDDDESEECGENNEQFGASLEPKTSKGHLARITPYQGSPMPSTSLKLECGKYSKTLQHNRAVSAICVNPPGLHSSQLLEGVILPKNILSHNDHESVKRTNRFGGKSIVQQKRNNNVNSKNNNNHQYNMADKKRRSSFPPVNFSRGARQNSRRRLPPPPIPPAPTFSSWRQNDGHRDSQYPQLQQHQYDNQYQHPHHHHHHHHHQQHHQQQDALNRCWSQPAPNRVDRGIRELPPPPSALMHPPHRFNVNQVYHQSFATHGRGRDNSRFNYQRR